MTLSRQLEEMRETYCNTLCQKRLAIKTASGNEDETEGSE
jgi:hypothetical protein